MMHVLWRVCGALALWSVGVPVFAAVTYRLTEIGGLSSEWAFVGGLAINDRAQITGEAKTGDSNSSGHAFLYTNGVMKDLGTLGGSESYGTAINNYGQVVGNSHLAGGGPYHAFVTEGGTLRDLGTLGGTYSVANGINNSGVIVGSASTPDEKELRAYRYAGGVMTDLGTLGGPYSQAYAINDRSEITGEAITGDWGYHAFLYGDGGMTDLGTLSGPSGYSFGSAINDAGQVTGQSSVMGHPEGHAFLYSRGTMIDIGATAPGVSAGHGINDSGDVVGFAWFTSGPYPSAFVYSAGRLFDLNQLLDPATAGNWYLQDAYDINDNGQIIAWAFREDMPGITRTVLLTPVPEAATWALMALGLTALVLSPRRQREVKSGRRRGGWNGEWRVGGCGSLASLPPTL